MQNNQNLSEVVISDTQNTFTQENEQENSTELEASMKDLLEKILSYLEKFIRTKEDLKIVEDKLNDYDNMQSLLDIIKNIFQHLTIKVDENLAQQNKNGNSNNTSTQMINQSEYEALEKIVQKHEQEIRTHIRLEQQLKLYAENLQQKLDDSEKTRAELLESSTNMIRSVKKENQIVNDNIAILQTQNKEQQKKIEELEQMLQQNQNKVQNVNFLQEKVFQLEKIINNNDNVKLQSARNASASRDKNTGPNSNQLTSVNSQNLAQYKKLSMDIDYKNGQKSETPQPIQKQKSPIKDKKSLLSNFEQSSQRSTHNTSGNDYLKVKIEIGQKLKEKPDFKNSYQRFYNQVKQAKDDQIRQMNVYNRNKDLKSLYNSATASKNINMSHKDQKGLVVGQSYQGSHNGSFAQVQNQLNKNFSMTSSSLGKANKRSKSHTQHNNYSQISASKQKYKGKGPTMNYIHNRNMSSAQGHR